MSTPDVPSTATTAPSRGAVVDRSDAFIAEVELARASVFVLLETTIANAHPGNRAETEAAFATATTTAIALQRKLAEISEGLPSYVQRKCTLAINYLIAAVETSRDKALPKAQFSFVRRPLPAGAGANAVSAADSSSGSTAPAGGVGAAAAGTVVSGPELPVAPGSNNANSQIKNASMFFATAADSSASASTSGAGSGMVAPTPVSAHVADFSKSSSANDANRSNSSNSSSSSSSNIDGAAPDVTNLRRCIIIIGNNNNNNKDNASTRSWKDIPGTYTAESIVASSKGGADVLPPWTHQYLNLNDDVSTPLDAPWRIVNIDRDFTGTDLWLTHLDQCVVVAVSTPLVALRFNDISNSVLFFGPVAGSAHIERVRNAFVAVACRQARIHHTQRTHFSLATRSEPIIEHTSAVLFAPYTLDGPRVAALARDAQIPVPLAGGAGLLPPHRDSAGPGTVSAESDKSDKSDIVGVEGLWSKEQLNSDALWGGLTPEQEASTSAWAHVADFHWHRVQKSPNWDIAPREQRVRHAVPPCLEQNLA